MICSGTHPATHSLPLTTTHSQANTTAHSNSLPTTSTTTGRLAVEEVNMTTVDTYVRRAGITQLDVLKIDAEGNDNKVGGCVCCISTFTPYCYVLCCAVLCCAVLHSVVLCCVFEKLLKFPVELSCEY